MKKFAQIIAVMVLMAVAFTTGVALTQNRANKDIDRITQQMYAEHRERIEYEKLVQDMEYINRKVDAIPAQYAVSCFDTNTGVSYRFVKVGRTAQGQRYTVTYETLKVHNASEFADSIRAMETSLDSNELLRVEVLGPSGNPL